MDLALTFHVGLCLRIPNNERKALNDLPIEPLAACWRTLHEAVESLRHAEEAEDFQTIGMRSREALLDLIHVAQECVPMPNGQEKPNKSNFRGWLEIVSKAALPGPNQQERRSLLKAGGENAWKFTNWLTHAKDSHFADAEAALAITELAISLLSSAIFEPFAVFLTDARRAARRNSRRREVSIQAILRPPTSALFVISVAGWMSPWRSNHCPLKGTDKFPTRNAS